ncbi:hypothetical protein ACGFYZ_12810 [Streptomyces sp. NPDC048330]|uniref:hypothetical protein n=1 Tax=Streptomyces sp. NPDC048330 TaxID=3365533 RepID=UPI003720032C
MEKEKTDLELLREERAAWNQVAETRGETGPLRPGEDRKVPDGHTEALKDAMDATAARMEKQASAGGAS